MILYHPTPEEIRAVLADPWRRSKSLRSRIERAARILADQLIFIADTDAYRSPPQLRVRSCSRPDISYWPAAGRCECEDSPPATSDNRKWCKHAIAYHAYCVCLDKALEPILRLAPNDHGTGHVIIGPREFIGMKYVDTAIAGHRTDPIIASHRLARYMVALGVTVDATEEAPPRDLAPAPGPTKPIVFKTIQQYHHWLHSGDLPVMAANAHYV